MVGVKVKDFGIGKKFLRVVMAKWLVVRFILLQRSASLNVGVRIDLSCNDDDDATHRVHERVVVYLCL